MTPIFLAPVSDSSARDKYRYFGVLAGYGGPGFLRAILATKMEQSD